MATEKVEINKVEDTGRQTKTGDPILKVYLTDGRTGSAFDARFLDLDVLDTHQIEVRVKGTFQGKEDLVFNLPKNTQPLFEQPFVKPGGEPTVIQPKPKYPDPEIKKQPPITADNPISKTGTSVIPWEKALEEGKGEFLAITGKEEEAMIEAGFAKQIIEEKAELKTCTRESITNAIINVAATGMTLNPVLQLAYLVKRKDKCMLDISYRGLTKILKDFGAILDIQAIIVYEDEAYEEGISQLNPPTHKKTYAKSKEEQKKRKILGVYSQVVLPDRNVIYTPLMPNWEILEARAASPGSNHPKSAWQNWPEEMYKKTKIKRDFKTLISGSPNKKALKALAVMDEADRPEGTVTVKGTPKRSVMADIFAKEPDTIPEGQSYTEAMFGKEDPEEPVKKAEKGAK